MSTFRTALVSLTVAFTAAISGAAGKKAQAAADTTKDLDACIEQVIDANMPAAGTFLDQKSGFKIFPETDNRTAYFRLHDRQAGHTGYTGVGVLYWTDDNGEMTGKLQVKSMDAAQSATFAETTIELNAHDMQAPGKVSDAKMSGTSDEAAQKVKDQAKKVAEQLRRCKVMPLT